MNKEFVPYELALKLKQLGFDEPCIATHGYLELYINTDDGHLKAPLYQQAFRWFREDLTCDSWIRPNLVIDGPKIYQFLINDKLDDEWYETYEEAELACLTKLIDLKSE